MEASQTVERPEGATQTQPEKKATTTYTVLERAHSDVEVGVDEASAEPVVQTQEVWRELATVELPARSRSASAVTAALQAAKRTAKDGMVFRVLDEGAARQLTLQPKPLPPVEERFDVVGAE
jgi:hypothetical protein